MQLLDTVIVGTEKVSEINGITIVAGYFVTDPNSRGEQNAIYYATFEIGDCKVYLENGGMKDDSETIKSVGRSYPEADRKREFGLNFF